MGKKTRWGTFRREGYLQLYLLILPSFLLLLLFKYVPMGGIIVAFQDFNIFSGIAHSPFVGLKHFHDLFTSEDFLRVLRNTIIINFYKLIFWVPLPVVTAVMLNEIRRRLFKGTIQTVIYMPHFLSWVIVGGIFVNLLSTNGPVNSGIEQLGGSPVKFMIDPQYFRHVIVASSMWKEVGWGTIVYLAAITGINPQLYEAAMIDGAGKWQQMRHVTLPSLTSTIILMTLMSLGNILTNSFEQILVMYNPAVYDVGDVIETYVFRYGIGQMQYSYTTAVGLFTALVGFLLVFTTNAFCRKWFGKSLW